MSILQGSKKELSVLSAQIAEKGMVRKEGGRSLGRVCYPGLSFTRALASTMIHVSCHLHYSIEEVGYGSDSDHFSGGWFDVDSLRKIFGSPTI